MIEQSATSASRSLLIRLPELPREGRVHSVFARAVNLKWDDEGWACLLEPPLPLNPSAILLSEVPVPQRGETARISRTEIVIRKTQVRILLDRAVSVDLRLLPVGPWDRPLVHSRIRELRSLLETWGQTTSFAISETWGQTTSFADTSCLCTSSADETRSLSPGTTSLGETRSLSPGTTSLGETRSLSPGMEANPLTARMDSIVEEIRRVDDDEEVGRRLRSLVGLGTGLTPAGDDFLVGFLAASLFFDVAKVARRSLVDGFPEWTRGRTANISQRMLDAAVHGEFALPVHRLLQSVVRPENGLLGRARELLGVGGSSGADTLAGVLFCLESFPKGQP